MRASPTAEEGTPEKTNSGAHQIVELMEGNQQHLWDPPGATI